MNEVSNRIAIVTGGNRGIGRATALLLAREGATVIIIGRNAGLNDETVALIREAGGKAAGYVMDVTDETGAKELITELAVKYGRVDILVNNAGICQWQVPFETWRIAVGTPRSPLM